MISIKKLSEIKNHLEESQNPLFFFDNDQDGLCSYLILRRFLGRGKGVPVKTNPLSKDYFRRVKEFNPDKIFVLDVPEISNEFLEEVKKINLPLVHVDHHDVPKSKYVKEIFYYNSFSKRTKEGIPVTPVCYKITQRKKDLWIAVAGSIADKYVPKFYKDFLKIYPEMGIKSQNAFEILYNSDIGKIARMLGFSLKDRTTNVMKMMRFVIDAKSPYDLLNESKENSIFYRRFKELEDKMSKLVSKAKEKFSDNPKSNLFYFKYSGDTSMSADLSNKLSYLHPGKFIVVAYVKGNLVNISTRGKNIKSHVLKALKKIPNSRGGGHEDATGAQIPADELDFFVNEIKISLSEM